MTHSLEDLFDEVRLLGALLDLERERLHADQPVTRGMRGVLEVLRLEGPRPVPAIARQRHVSRQHAQALVNRLKQLRLVALSPNPEHRRSVLVRLTPVGRRTFERMRVKERRGVARLERGLRGAGLVAAAQTLRRVREALLSEG